MATAATEKSVQSEKASPENAKQQLPNSADLKASADAAEKALKAQGIAQKLRETASNIADPKKREKLLRDAYDKEVEAHGASKKARMLSSGAFQGGVGGAGIGTAVGAGVGTVVGTLVGGVTAIPTTGLGALVGSGVGAIHGPWIKLPPIGGGKGKADKQKEGEKAEDEKSKNAAAVENPEDEDGVMPDPKVLREAAEAVAKEQDKEKKGGDAAESGDREMEEKKKPRKLHPDQGEKKKPRKIEIRSNQQAQKAN